jgi:pyrroline-5-carboxylate reductase
MAKTKKSIGFIGAGKMAEALISGIINASVAKPDSITVSDMDASRVKHMAGTYHVKSTGSNAKLAEACDVIVLAVKPNNVEKVLYEIKEFINENKLIISIAAGIREEFIRKGLSWDMQPQVLRVMPNTPAQVLEGASGLYFNENCSEENIDYAKKVFDAVGVSVVIKKESMIDAITALSGSGPAYVFFFIEALSDAGVSMGLSRDVSQELAIQTVFGAAKMAKETGIHPTILKEMVTSPGGTTIQALRSLEMDGVKGSIIDAVNRAYKKSKKLSKKG